MQKNIDGYLVVPHCILWNKDLSSTDKFLLAKIHYMDKLKNTSPGCWMTNRSLGEYLKVTDVYISGAVQKLLKLGLISRTGKGRSRILTSNLIVQNDKEHKQSLSNEHKQSLSNEHKQSLSSTPMELKQSPIEHKQSLSINTTSRIKNLNKIEHINIDKNKDKNKEDNINMKKTPLTKVEFILNKLSKNKREAIQDIFDYWNAYKDGGKWQSHRKITPDMIDAILDNLKKYTVADIYSAIDNYAKVLQGANYFWDYVWPLSTFLSVKDGKTKDAYKKWWKFLEENFVEENYFLTRRNSYVSNSKQDEKMPEDPNPEFTVKLIKAHRRFSGRRWNPIDKEKAKFIQATILVFGKKPNLTHIQQGYLIDDLVECLDAHYFSKGDPVHPGHYCSEFTWNTLLPQYWRAMGVPDDRFLLYREDQVDIEEECN